MYISLLCNLTSCELMRPQPENREKGPKRVLVAPAKFTGVSSTPELTLNDRKSALVWHAILR
jgi:hypothetical protein